MLPALGILLMLQKLSAAALTQPASCESQVSRSLSSMSMKSSVPGVLQRLSSRTFGGPLHENVQDSNTPLRELALQTPSDVNTPFTQRLQVGFSIQKQKCQHWRMADLNRGMLPHLHYYICGNIVGLFDGYRFIVEAVFCSQ